MTDEGEPDPRVASLFKRGRPSASVIEARRAKAMVLARIGAPATRPMLGRYELRDRIGGGGFGDVYVAFDERLQRQVAVKVLRTAGGVRQPNTLLHEARAMAKLAHRNVVAVHDAGEHDGEMYIVMDLIEGETLGEWLTAAPRSWVEVLDVFVEAGQGLAGAHAAGLVHRDFKPANVLMGVDGRVQVTDFGLAALARELRGQAQRAGTRGYWAPEVEAGGVTVGPSADQYSYCVALSEALAGRTPPAPRWLTRLVAQGQARAPADRWTSMQALVDALSARRKRSARRRRFVVVAAAVGLCSAGVTAVVLTRAHRPCDGVGTESGQTVALSSPAIEAAFSSAKPARGREVWQAQAARLEVYASALGEERRGVCEALRSHRTRLTAPDDVRADEVTRRAQLCLEQRAWELESLIRVFESADASVVEHAANAVSLMVEQGDCNTQDVTLPLPTGEQYLATLDIRKQLADVTELQHAGRYSDALRIATEVEQTAQRVGYAPLTARAAFLRGVQLLFLQQPGEAKVAFEASLVEANRGRDPERAAWAQTLLAQTVGVYAQEPEAGLAWADAADASLAGLAEHVELTTALGSIRGQIAVARGDYALASKLASEALARRRAQVSSTHPKLADALLLVGNIAYRAQRSEAAASAYREALSIRQQTFGPAHPQTAVAHNNVALVLLAEGRHAEAAQHLDAALSIWDPQEDALDVARARMNLHLIATATGDFSKAEPGLRVLLEALPAQGAGARRLRSQVLNALADVWVEQARWEEARGALERSLELWEEGHPVRMGAHYRLAGVLEHQGQFEAARAQFERTIAVAQQNYDPDSITVLGARAAMAASIAASGDTDGARRILDEVVATAGGAFEGDVAAAAVHRELGRAWARVGEAQRARTWLLRAGKGPKPDARERAELAVLQAEVEVALGPREAPARDALSRANNSIGQSLPRYRARLAALERAVSGGV